MYQDINFTNNHHPSNVVSKIEKHPFLLTAAPSQRPSLLYDMHTDARLVSVCVSTLYILAPCPQPRVFSAPLAWDRAKVGERRPGEVPQPSSYPPTCPIPQHVKCPILHSTVHLKYHSAPPPLLCCSPPISVLKGP